MFVCFRQAGGGPDELDAPGRRGGREALADAGRDRGRVQEPDRAQGSSLGRDSPRGRGSPHGRSGPVDRPAHGSVRPCGRAWARTLGEGAGLYMPCATTGSPTPTRRRRPGPRRALGRQDDDGEPASGRPPLSGSGGAEPGASSNTSERSRHQASASQNRPATSKRCLRGGLSSKVRQGLIAMPRPEVPVPDPGPSPGRARRAIRLYFGSWPSTDRGEAAVTRSAMAGIGSGIGHAGLVSLLCRVRPSRAGRNMQGGRAAGPTDAPPNLSPISAARPSGVPLRTRPGRHRAPVDSRGGRRADRRSTQATQSVFRGQRAGRRRVEEYRLGGRADQEPCMRCTRRSLQGGRGRRSGARASSSTRWDLSLRGRRSAREVGAELRAEVLLRSAGDA